MRFFLGLTLSCAAMATGAGAEHRDLKNKPVINSSHHVSAISLRPILRPQPTALTSAVHATSTHSDFSHWLGKFRDRAIQLNIPAYILDGALSNITYDTDVIARDQNQSEFTRTIWEYLDAAVSQHRIQSGREALDRFAENLTAIENTYGVEKEVVVAIWGLESAYGEFRGRKNVVQSLATLSFDGRRGTFFESQLIAALRILQNGDIGTQDITGSWAGAMGHTQFMPTSFLEYAVDFNGDGKRDIWSDDPTDALASTAAYLKRFGWTQDQPWGVEVKLPANFDFELVNRNITRLPSVWTELGVRAINRPVTDTFGPASLLTPAGRKGAAFMVFKNFNVIKRYNSASAYVMGVGHLSDRLQGRPPIQATWPRDDRALKLSERKELQTRLARRGFNPGEIDGMIGPMTTAAVKKYQNSLGLIPDGYISLNLLKKLH